jgi:hypothetical protein
LPIAECLSPAPPAKPPDRCVALFQSSQPPTGHNAGMTQLTTTGIGLLAGVCFVLAGAGITVAQTTPAVVTAQQPSVQKGAARMTHARGTFDVKLVPQTTADTPETAGLGRMSIDKQFHGDLDGTSKGEMLTGMSSVKGSAGYVAIERVTGTLQGRTGSFILEHTGLMNRGAPSLSIIVVPDSGTGQLTGIAGTLAITITDGQHFYDFEYTLADTP